MIRRINSKATIKNILDMCCVNSNISINVEKFNAKEKTDEFLIAAANYCKVDIVYVQ